MKYIKGWEGLYSITESGEVFSHSKNIFRSKTVNKHNGYEYVTLKKKGRVTETKSVHRLVALAYVSNPFSKEEVDHIDCNKTNNRCSNLQWASRSEQVQYQYDRGSRKSYINKISSKVFNIVTGEEFDSIKKLSLALGVNYETAKWRIKFRKWDWVIR